MSKRAEDFQNNHKQLYEVDSYPIEVVKELEQNAYIAAEKETIERAIAWLDENVDDYIINCTDSYSDAPFKAIASRKCFDDLREAIEQEPKNYRIRVKDMPKVAQWNSVEKSLPPYDEEVIVLRNEFNGVKTDSANFISFGHRPNPKGWDGKDIITGKVTHHEPLLYDGWNIPGVKYWMPCPKLPEE